MAEGADQDERTESATPRRKAEAREKGQVAKSQDLTSAFMFLVGLMTIRFVFPSIFSELMGIMKSTFSMIGSSSWALDSGGPAPGTESGRFPVQYPISSVGNLLLGALMSIGKMLAPFAVVMFVSSLVINFAQVGFLISGESITPKFDRLNPIKGVSRLISKRTIVMLVQSIFKIMAVGYVLYVTIKGKQDMIMGLADMPIAPAIGLITGLIFKMGLRAGILLFAIAAFDYIYQRWEYERSLKMTKQEVKDEMKQSEGDPLVKSRIRSIQREMARKRMMQEVPTADIVITNPTTLAVALKYELGADEAPRVIAKGARLIAERIKAIAQKHNIPIIEDKALAQLLYKLELEQEIPVALYRAVAEILARVLNN